MKNKMKTCNGHCSPQAKCKAWIRNDVRRPRIKARNERRNSTCNDVRTRTCPGRDCRVCKVQDLARAARTVVEGEVAELRLDSLLQQLQDNPPDQHQD